MTTNRFEPLCKINVIKKRQTFISFESLTVPEFPENDSHKPFDKEINENLN